MQSVNTQPDRKLTVMNAITAVLLVIASYMAFVYAPTEQTMGAVQRISRIAQGAQVLIIRLDCFTNQHCHAYCPFCDMLPVGVSAAARSHLQPHTNPSRAQVSACHFDSPPF